MKGCTDTLETLLGAEVFAEAEFNSRYDAVVDILEETPYDTLLSIQSEMFFISGLEKLKHNEFRLAVLEYARHPEQSTYGIVTAVYPNYLHFLADSGVTNQDFEQFCLDVEDSLISYGPLVSSDPFFTDSVDAYLFRAVFGMLEGTLSASAVATGTLKSSVATGNLETAVAMGTLKAAMASGIRRTGRNNALPAAQMLHFLATSPEVAAVVASDMMNSDFIRGDILRAAVKKAWLMKKGTVVFPTIVTEFPEYHSDTSADIKGYLTWDGGAPVTARGIVWAEYDDPTTSDHTLAAGSGTGDFSVTLGQLEKGKSYYVRSYAVNSAGTAYGNCVKYVASLPSGSEVPALAPGELSVFPNPSSGKVKLRFSLEAPTTVGLRVTDMAGREVMRRQASRLPQGLNQLTLDLSPLTDGVYICRLNCGSESLVRRIVIDR